jgi:hypothetical protein
VVVSEEMSVRMHSHQNPTWTAMGSSCFLHRIATEHRVNRSDEGVFKLKTTVAKGHRFIHLFPLSNVPEFVTNNVMASNLKGNSTQPPRVISLLEVSGEGGGDKVCWQLFTVCN